MNIIKFIIFIILGIIIFFILNKGDGFNIGVPWIVINTETGINIDKLNGSPFTCRLRNGAAWTENPYIAIDLENKCFKNFSDALTPNPNDVIYHVIPDTVENQYRLNVEKCFDPHKKIQGNLPLSQIDDGTTPSSIWKNKTQENSETKPLIPRKNLIFTRPSEAIELRPPYDIGSTLLYPCDTNKTQIKDPHRLACKSRKKFVLNSHGILEDQHNKGYKTSVPQLFQLMLYKPMDGNGCMRSSMFDDKTMLDLVNNNSEITSNNELASSSKLSKLILEGGPPITLAQMNEKKTPKNKKYLASLDLSQKSEERPLEELVYSEFTNLNSGALYVSCEYLTGLNLVGGIDSARYFEFVNGNMGCFTTESIADREGLPNAELLMSLAKFFLCPFMTRATILYYSNSESLDLINLEGIHPELLTTIEINYSGPTDSYFRDLTVTHNTYRYDDPTKKGKGISFPTLDSSKWERIFGSLDDPALLYKAYEAPCWLGVETQLAKYDLAMNVPGYPPAHSTELNAFEFVNGTKTNDDIARDNPFTPRPVYYYRYNIGTPTQATIQALQSQVKALLISCCVTIDPSLLRPEFKMESGTNYTYYNRLFPNNTSPRRFPLLYFDIYARDGFEHPERGSPFSLDETDSPHGVAGIRLGDYTSSDLRLLVTEIINQIHIGSRIDTGNNVEEYGYYQLFKKKMMLEKGLNDEMCREKLLSMFRREEHTPPAVFIHKSKIVTQYRYLWASLLQTVWGNYGYDYKFEHVEGNDNGYNDYSFLADIPIIFAKLFKTEYGESADVHIFCCIRGEDTSVRSIQKTGYWGCTDNAEWQGDAGTGHNCDFYNNNTIAGRTSIKKCRDWGHHGANDNCCICKMVKNMNEEEANPDLRPNVGPNCKVKECKETLHDKNRELEGRLMSITESNWQQNNLWTGEPEGRLDESNLDNRNDRKMGHTETAYRYISDQIDDDYGKLQLIDDGSSVEEEGVLRRTSPITVYCKHQEATGIIEGTADDRGWLYDAGIIAGELLCDVRKTSDPYSDKAVYSGDLECPENLCSAVTIDVDYYSQQAGESIPPLAGGGMSTGGGSGG